MRAVTASPGVDLAALAATDQHVELLPRAYAPGDLEGARIAIATGEDDLDVDTLVAAEAATAGVAAPATIVVGDVVALRPLISSLPLPDVLTASATQAPTMQAATRRPVVDPVAAP